MTQIKSLLSFLFIVVLVLGLFPTSSVVAQDDGYGNLPLQAQFEAASAAADWLLTQQQADGGWSDGFSEGTSPGSTADVILALATVGVDVSAVISADGNTPLDYLETYLNQNDLSTNAGLLSKFTIALVAAGQDPFNFGGFDLVGQILDLQNGDGGFALDMGDEFSTFNHCLAMLGLYNAGADVPESAVAALTAMQSGDGGWEFAAGLGTDSNTTAICVQALIVIDSDEARISAEAGLNYLLSIQNEDSGFPYQNPSEFGTDSDATSTALVAQAFIAFGAPANDWNAVAAFNLLLAFRNDSGSFSNSFTFPGDNIYATASVIPALTLTPLNAANALEMTLQ